MSKTKDINSENKRRKNANINFYYYTFYNTRNINELSSTK